MVKRNEPCPCNSGKKYKKCCGQLSEFPVNTSTEASTTKEIEKNPSALIHEGNALLHSGKMREALICYKKALELEPDNPEIYNYTGYIYFISGQLPLAQESYKNAIRLNPDLPDVYFSYGNTLQNLGRHEEAIKAYQEAILRTPSNFKIYTNMGVSMAKVGNSDNAAAAFQKAVSLNPTDILAHENWANTLIEQGLAGEAEKVLLQLLANRKNDARVYLTLAKLYERINNREQSEFFARQVLNEDPHNPVANRLMATLLRHQGKAGEGLSLLTMTKIPSHDRNLSMEMYYELGKLYDRMQDSEKAMLHFGHANRLWQDISSRDKMKYFREVTVIRESYRRHKEELCNTIQSDKPLQGHHPIFQVGFPRSGTTLLANILDSHPELQVLSEKLMLVNIANQLASHGNKYPDVLLRITDEELQNLRKLYWQEAEKWGITPSKRFIDEHPFGIVHCNLAARLFPTTRIILNVRHPCDVCLSCFMQSFQDNDGMANFTSLQDTVALYVETMGLLLEYEQSLPVPFHRFSYEGLIEDFQGEMTSLVDFLGIHWSDTFQNFHLHASKKDIIGTASYSQVVEPLYTRAKYRWHNYREYLEPHILALRPFIEAFGYEV